MANGSQYLYLNVHETYVISKFSKLMDMCAT